MAGPSGRSKENLSVHSEVIKLKSELQYVKESGRERDELLRQIVQTQDLLARKTIAFETNQIHHKEMLEDLKKDTKLQTKILAAILSSVLGAAITLIAKALTHGA